MEITVQTIILFLATLLTGLSAGLFYAWQISVIPGTKLASDSSYLETMQHINRAIINPLFMLIFMGSLIVQVVSLLLYLESPIAFWLLLAATVSYTVTLGITGAGNVPLNDTLDEVNLEDLVEIQKKKVRVEYESPWNLLHLIRTIFSVLSFILLLLTAFISN